MSSAYKREQNARTGVLEPVVVFSPTVKITGALIVVVKEVRKLALDIKDPMIKLSVCSNAKKASGEGPTAKWKEQKLEFLLDTKSDPEGKALIELFQSQGSHSKRVAHVKVDIQPILECIAQRRGDSATSQRRPSSPKLAGFSTWFELTTDEGVPGGHVAIKFFHLLPLPPPEVPPPNKKPPPFSQVVQKKPVKTKSSPGFSPATVPRPARSPIRISFHTSANSSSDDDDSDDDVFNLKPSTTQSTRIYRPGIPPPRRPAPRHPAVAAAAQFQAKISF